ncbi:MAG TPA: Ppx/GppA phosphatase family protein [Sporichthyaceae bacterium]|jgi:exopolyphosphatase/guanosine-5'-triphosphate,3'-diphosphate pyrophosphatase
MKRVAAIDCGTNSIRLLIAQVGADGTLVDLDRRMQVVRLGQGVDATGRLAPEALARTFAAAREYAAAIAAAEVDGVRVVATSATRDASNRAEFEVGMAEIFGVAPEVVPGEVEAALSFAGATSGLAAAGVAAPYLVVDIGGGSTEFVLGTEAPLAARSVDVGCVRMRERRLLDDPPTAAQIDAATSDIDAAIAQAAAVVPLDGAASLIGVAGTVTTLTAIALGLQSYDPEAIHRARVPAAKVRAIAARLLGLTRAERAAIPVMHPGRVDVIAAGALVLERVLAATGAAELIASEHDILDGIAASVLGPRG